MDSFINGLIANVISIAGHNLLEELGNINISGNHTVPRERSFTYANGWAVAVMIVLAFLVLCVAALVAYCIVEERRLLLHGGHKGADGYSQSASSGTSSRSGSEDGDEWDSDEDSGEDDGDDGASRSADGDEKGGVTQVCVRGTAAGMVESPSGKAAHGAKGSSGQPHSPSHANKHAAAPANAHSVSSPSHSGSRGNGSDATNPLVATLLKSSSNLSSTSSEPQYDHYPSAAEMKRAVNAQSRSRE